MSRARPVSSPWDRLYRGLLLFYPAAFRARFGDELLQVCRTAEANESASSLRLAASLMAGGLREHWHSLQWGNLMCWLMALVLGVIIALVDRRATEPQPAALALIVVAFALTLWRPRGSWWRAFLLGAGIPGLAFVTAWLHPHAAGLPQPVPAAGLIALIPALLGAGAARMLRWLIVHAV